MKLRRGVSRKQDYGDLFQDWEIAVARNLINQFRAAWDSLNQVDVEDLLQECLTHWHFKKCKYDPKRKASIKTFMSRIVHNKLIDLRREGESDKRKASNLTISLDRPVSDDDQTTHLDKFENNTVNDNANDPLLSTDVSIDLKKAISNLNPKQKNLCQLLGPDGLNISEASKYLKTPRSTIYDELKRIKEIFKKQGLDEYL